MVVQRSAWREVLRVVWHVLVRSHLPHEFDLSAAREELHERGHGVNARRAW